MVDKFFYNYDYPLTGSACSLMYSELQINAVTLGIIFEYIMQPGP